MFDCSTGRSAGFARTTFCARGASDHAAFHRAGIPFLYFGVEDHPDYHRPTDTAERVDPRFFGDVTDLIVEALRTLDRRMP